DALLASARQRGIAVESIDVVEPSDLEASLERVQRAKPEALIVFVDQVTLPNRERIARFAERTRLPSIFQARAFVTEGGLLSYGPDMGQQVLGTAIYVDKILRGSRPAELAVEQPTKFELV